MPLRKTSQRESAAGATAFTLIELLVVIAIIAVLAAIVFPALVYVLVLVLTWPRPPWLAVSLVAIALAIVVPIVFFPFARVIWLAFDVAIRPIEPAEYDRARALD